MADEPTRQPTTNPVPPSSTGGTSAARPASGETPAARGRAADPAEEARRTRQDAKEAAIKRVDEETKAREESIEEAQKRQSESKPTPTQRENDLAKLGALDIDDKEDDGSGPEPVYQRVAVPQGDEAKYKTRDVSKK